MLNYETVYKQGDQITDQYEKGRGFSLSIAYGSR
jgi:hypothetical protein